jgi:hypothetical protein
MTISPNAIRSLYTDHFTSSMLPVLEELFGAEYARHASKRDQLFKQKSTDRDIWQASELHDVPLMQEVPEGTEYPVVRPKQGANKTLNIKKFGLAMTISEEAVEDGKIDLVAESIKRLGRSARESQEIDGMNVLNLGFTSQTTNDGLSLFNTAHTLPSGGTFSNRAAQAAALSSSSLEAALQDFEKNFVGDSGIFYNIRPKCLLTSVKNKRLAKELLGSELKPETETNSTTGITNINNYNSYSEEGLQAMSSVHLTDDDAWFLLAEAEDTGLVVVTRKPIETSAAGKDLGFMSDTMVYKIKYREVVDATHPYGVWGNAGS